MEERGKLIQWSRRSTRLVFQAEDYGFGIIER
jgi:hypothetical protein